MLVHKQKNRVFIITLRRLSDAEFLCIRKTPCLTRGSKDAMRLTIKSPLAKLKLRSANCNMPSKGGSYGSK